MLILHIAPTPFFSDRGCHIRIDGIVRCMDTLDFEHELCTYHLGYDRQGITTYRIAPVLGYRKTSAGPSLFKPWADWKLSWLCAKRIRKAKPAALHAHLHEGVLIALLSRLLAFRPTLPIIADMQGSLVGELESYGFFKRISMLKWPFKVLEQLTLASATRIVCSSEHALEKLRHDYPGCAHKLTLAQDGADAADSIPEARLQALTQQYGMDDSKLCVVYSGALLESKGLKELKHLLRACQSDADKLHFLIIGYPLESISDFLQTHELTHLCTLTGRLPYASLPEHLALADVAIDTKNSDAGEGSGKMLNYLASGLPVVAFDTINNLHFLGEDAILCQTVSQMRQQLLIYADNEAQRQTAAQHNRERFNKLFSWSVTAQQLTVPYQALGLTSTNSRELGDS